MEFDYTYAQMTSPEHVWSPPPPGNEKGDSHLSNELTALDDTYLFKDQNDRRKVYTQWVRKYQHSTHGKIKKNLYDENIKPEFWPEGVEFCSAYNAKNKATKQGAKLSVEQLERALACLRPHVKPLYEKELGHTSENPPDTALKDTTWAAGGKFPENNVSGGYKDNREGIFQETWDESKNFACTKHEWFSPIIPQTVIKLNATAGDKDPRSDLTDSRVEPADLHLTPEECSSYTESPKQLPRKRHSSTAEPKQKKKPRFPVDLADLEPFDPSKEPNGFGFKENNQAFVNIIDNLELSDLNSFQGFGNNVNMASTGIPQLPSTQSSGHMEKESRSSQHQLLLPANNATVSVMRNSASSTIADQLIDLASGGSKQITEPKVTQQESTTFCCTSKIPSVINFRHNKIEGNSQHQVQFRQTSPNQFGHEGIEERVKSTVNPDWLKKLGIIPIWSDVQVTTEDAQLSTHASQQRVNTSSTACNSDVQAFTRVDAHSDNRIIVRTTTLPHTSSKTNKVQNATSGNYGKPVSSSENSILRQALIGARGTKQDARVNTSMDTQQMYFPNQKQTNGKPYYLAAESQQGNIAPNNAEYGTWSQASNAIFPMYESNPQACQAALPGTCLQGTSYAPMSPYDVTQASPRPEIKTATSALDALSLSDLLNEYL